MSVGGTWGKILHVDLTNRSLEIESPDESFYRQYIGGSLMGLFGQSALVVILGRVVQGIGGVTGMVVQYGDGSSSPSLVTVTGGTISITYDGDGNFTGATSA